jgi:hypothetical protein
LRRLRLFLLLVAVLTIFGAVPMGADQGGAFTCETYFGCRKFDFGGGTFACRCDSLSSCTECCLVDTADCTVS